jgi:hypothetical protein
VRQQLLAWDPADPVAPVDEPVPDVLLPVEPVVPPMVLLVVPDPPVPIPLLLAPVLPLGPDGDVEEPVLPMFDAVRPGPQGEVLEELVDEPGPAFIVSVAAPGLVVELLAPGVVAEPELEVCAIAAPPRAMSAAAAEVSSSRFIQILLACCSPTRRSLLARARPTSEEPATHGTGSGKAPSAH